MERTPDRRYAIWHDRAVLHFLNDTADRDRYSELIARRVHAGGHAVIATFGVDGPDRCSGLRVARSSAQQIAHLLGEAGWVPRRPC